MADDSCSPRCDVISSYYAVVDQHRHLSVTLQVFWYTHPALGTLQQDWRLLCLEGTCRTASLCGTDSFCLRICSGNILQYMQGIRLCKLRIFVTFAAWRILAGTRIRCVKLQADPFILLLSTAVAVCMRVPPGMRSLCAHRRQHHDREKDALTVKELPNCIPKGRNKIMLKAAEIFGRRTLRSGPSPAEKEPATVDDTSVNEHIIISG